MTDVKTNKREFLRYAGLLAGGIGLAKMVPGASAATPDPKKPFGGFPLDYPGTGPIPWFKRIIHLYTGPDGHTVLELLPVNEPKGQQMASLLRKNAERVTIGGGAEGAGYKFHNAYQPTIIIPLLGECDIILHDNSVHTLVLGDLAFAEDCTGLGHMSRCGKGGNLMAYVQLAKSGCPATGSTDMRNFWFD